MTRRRPFFLLVAAALFACNALLGIDGDIDPPVQPGPPLDDAGDAGNATLRDGATGTYVITPPELALLQSGKKRLDVTASGVATETVAKVTLEALPKGVTVTPAELEIRGANTQSFQITVDPFAPPVSWNDTRVFVVSGGGGTRIPLPIKLSGPMDPTFGDGGVSVIPFHTPAIVTTARDLDMIQRNDVGLAVLPAGALLVAFSAKLAVADRGRAVTARLDRDGKLDSTYGNAGVAYLPDLTRGYGVTLLDDGTPLVTGADISNDAGIPNPPPHVWAATLNDAGGVLTKGAAEIMTTVDEALVSPVAFPNNTVVGLNQGTSATVPPVPGSSLISVTAHPVAMTVSTVDNPVGQPYALVRASTNTVFLVGEGASSVPYGLVLRRFLDGSVDPSWSVDGQIESTNYSTAARPSELFTGVLDDGGVLFGGTMAPTVTSPLSQLHLARFDLGGAVDPKFGDGGFVAHQPDNAQVAGIHAIVVMPNGRIIVGGYAEYATLRYVALARFEANGALDKTFGVDGFMTFYLGRRSELRRLVVQGSSIVAAIVTIDDVEGRDVVLVRFTP